ncbi:MAG TPA: hypothetical protein PKO28_01495 [Bacilli bacterium]|nr:hypothetical protein [Bacilli bacterium]HPS19271.1 hypothetical protein [Bacilli bacterium]
MYCYHCGKKIDEKKLEAKDPTLRKYANVVIDEGTDISYICPQCGHPITHGMSEENLKSLSRASHAELQRGRNHFARGMANNILSLILLVTSIIFLLLSRKADNQFRITLNVPEFWVFFGLAIASVILLGFGITYTVIGLRKKVMYEALLKDINNKTFVQ